MDQKPSLLYALARSDVVVTRVELMRLDRMLEHELLPESLHALGLARAELSAIAAKLAQIEKAAPQPAGKARRPRKR